ncbi:MAG TPA: pyridoxine 5'-phosphate synthase [Polyangiaceae bacterium]|nr:pyridoxine 5'-phosphate synthase [Polyangiaceae bacterium]
MTIRLHVNVDHVATVRNARGTTYPDPVHAAAVCERAGADGITAHLREDRRHITDRDVRRLRERVATFFNLEMAPTEEMVQIALEVRPDAVTLVPERREERTTEGGLDVVRAATELRPLCARLVDAGIKLSLFIAPDEAQVDGSRALGGVQVELHTGEYCHARGESRAPELARLGRAAQHARESGLEVAAGHGLTRHNVVDVAALDALVEVNIGHAIIADALFGGLDAAVRDMRSALDRGTSMRSLLRPDKSGSIAR